MENKELEFLVVCVPGLVKRDPLEQAQETLRIATEVADEIRSATIKCRSVTRIDGHPVSIIGLEMTGRTSVENIRITYFSCEEKYTKDYAIQDFYKL